MSYSTNKSAELLYDDQSDSQSVDEGSYSGSFSAGEPFLKKGPWTSGEDAILVDYVKKHGEGNWNAVQKHSGLFRCGKSCRLRWANHLRPNLKKGTFTADEERLIVELHAQMGNKWARMAARLPGRTDNEIKNYWNTRIKRMQRAGLPLYPPEMCLQTMNGSQNTQKNNEFNNYDVPDVSFDGLKTNHGGLSYVTNLPDISVRTILSYGQNSYLKHSVPTTIHHPKRAREQENIFPGFNGNFTGGISPFDQLQSDSGTKIHRSLALSIPYNPESKIKNYSPFGATTGCHAFLNGNISISMPISGTVKLELPSFQYPETDLGSWGKSPLLPSLNSVETFTQTSLLSEQANTECLSPRNSGLLDALLHESQTLNSAKNQSSEKSLSSSIVTQSDIMGSSTLNLCHTEWEDWFDPTSPFGPSATSSLGSCTPIRGSSSDKPLSSSESLPAAGSNTKQETIEPISTLDGGKTKISTQIDFSRPDALLGAGWFEYNIGYAKNHNIKTETTGTLLSEDICNNYRHMMGGISTVR